MKPIIQIGEAVIRFDGREYFFRPSFFAMATLGDKYQIVKIYKSVFDTISYSRISGAQDIAFSFSAGVYANKMLSDAVNVLSACCNCDLPEEMTGHFNERARWKFYKDGMPPTDLVNFARHLLHFGLVGERGDRSSSGDAESDGLDIVSFIEFAKSKNGLALSADDAKNLTMIEYQKQYEMAFPEMKKKDKDRQDAEQARDFYTELDKRRKQLAKEKELQDG